MALNLSLTSERVSGRTRGQNGDRDVPSRRPQLGQCTKVLSNQNVTPFLKGVCFRSFDKDFKARQDGSKGTSTETSDRDKWTLGL